MGDRREMDLYGLASFSLSVFKVGMIFPVFHMQRIISAFKEILMTDVRYSVDLGPRYFNMMGSIPSDTSALKVFPPLICRRFSQAYMFFVGVGWISLHKCVSFVCKLRHFCREVGANFLDLYGCYKPICF